MTEEIKKKSTKKSKTVKPVELDPVFINLRLGDRVTTRGIVKSHQTIRLPKDEGLLYHDFKLIEPENID